MVNLPLITLLVLFVGSGLGQLYSASTDGTAIGAAYTMSNSETNNQIIIYRLNSKGKLSHAGTVSTGANGQNQTVGFSASFGRGAIQVYSNYLFAINQGSQTLSMFTISPSNATSLTLNTARTVSTGQYPVSVTVSPTYACVLSRGATSGISCFTYNSSGLSSPPIDFDLGPYVANLTSPNIENPNQILFSKDSRVLIVSVDGAIPTVDRILFFSFDGITMLFVGEQRLSNNETLVSIALVGQNGLVITNAASTQFMIYSLVNNTFTSMLVSPTSLPSLAAMQCPVYSPTTDSYYGISDFVPYLCGLFTGLVELKVNLTLTQTDLFQIVPYYPSLCPGIPRDATLVTFGDTDYMFAINSAPGLINSYQLTVDNNPTAICFTTVQRDTADVSRAAGIAAHIQTSTPTSSVAPSSSVTSSLSSSVSTNSSSSTSSPLSSTSLSVRSLCSSMIIYLISLLHLC